MVVMIEKLKQQFDLVKAQLAADKKKAAALSGLAIILLVVLGRLVLSSNVPAETVASSAPFPRATAGVSAVPQVPPTPKAVNVRPPSVSDRAIGASPGTDLGAHSDTQAAARSISVAGMPRELARDLFNTSQWNKFLPALADSEKSSAGEKDKHAAGLWGHLRGTWSEYAQERREASQAFNHDLEQLALQSTMTGDNPMAYISGRLVKPGDEISGFSVVRILDRQVVVSREGVTATLEMK
jgi:hypothetical protein